MIPAPDRQAEGCSAGIDTGDYRDYSTYFFAALLGQARAGEALAVDPDDNGDGSVSLYEAHVYALRVGESADVPRTTSEVYLERWWPWYRRLWGSAPQPADNRYTQLALELAAKQGLPRQPQALHRALRERRRAHQTQERKVERERDGLSAENERLRGEIRFALEEKWPAAAYPYTLNFQRFLTQEVDAAQAFIAGHWAYPKLVRNQNRYAGLSKTLLSLERNAAQLDKIARMRRLGRILGDFARHASPEARADYERLLACEQHGL